MKTTDQIEQLRMAQRKHIKAAMEVDSNRMEGANNCKEIADQIEHAHKMSSQQDAIGKARRQA